MGFPYAADVGTPSYRDIEAFARRSGITFTVSSTTGGSHVSGSYHYTGNAIDMVSSAGSMQSLAAWLYQFSPYILELIHSGGPGYFVKNGKKVAASFYGAATVSQHYNHVHLAMTLSGIAAAVGSPPAKTVSTPVVPGGTGNGCFLPVLIGVIGCVAAAIGAVLAVWL